METLLHKRFQIIPVLLASFLMLESQAAFASASAVNQWLIGISGGAAFRDLSSSATVSNGTPISAPYNTDIFSINTSNHGGVAGLFGGYQWNRLSSYIPYYNLTLVYEHQFDSNITGNVQQYALPIFTNYNYTMNLTSDIIGVAGKVGLINYKFLIPYFSAGFGVAYNRVSSYSESFIAADGPPRVSPGYANNHNTNFAYTLGAGVNFICNEQASISLAYEYWNLGKINSGAGTGSWSGTSLNFGKLESNTVLATVTYFLT